MRPFSRFHTPWEDINLEAGPPDDECSLLPLPPALVFLPSAQSKVINVYRWKTWLRPERRNFRGTDKQKTKTLHVRDRRSRVLWGNDILNHSYTDRLTHKRDQTGINTSIFHPFSFSWRRLLCRALFILKPSLWGQFSLPLSCR